LIGLRGLEGSGAGFFFALVPVCSVAAVDTSAEGGASVGMVSLKESCPNDWLAVCSKARCGARERLKQFPVLPSFLDSFGGSIPTRRWSSASVLVVRVLRIFGTAPD
jgi:hypothetical protein